MTWRSSKSGNDRPVIYCQWWEIEWQNWPNREKKQRLFFFIFVISIERPTSQSNCTRAKECERSFFWGTTSSHDSNVKPMLKKKKKKMMMMKSIKLRRGKNSWQKEVSQSIRLWVISFFLDSFSWLFVSLLRQAEWAPPPPTEKNCATDYSGFHLMLVANPWKALRRLWLSPLWREPPEKSSSSSSSRCKATTIQQQFRQRENRSDKRIRFQHWVESERHATRQSHINATCTNAEPKT